MDYVKDDLLKQTFRHPDADVHSATAWATFMKGKPQNITEITLRNSEETLNYLGGEDKLRLTIFNEMHLSNFNYKDVYYIQFYPNRMFQNGIDTSYLFFYLKNILSNH